MVAKAAASSHGRLSFWYSTRRQLRIETAVMKKAIVLLMTLAGCSTERDTCYSIDELSCSREPAPCAMYFGATYATQVVCEQVTPAGNCRPLDEFTPDHSASCGDVSGDAWCCSPDSDASCLPFDDVACDGPSLTDVVAMCETAFGAGYVAPRTCLPSDGPGSCKNLSRMGQLTPTCDGESRNVWCCSE